MVELHAGELLLGCLPVGCQQAARIGAHLHELHGLLDVRLGRKHRPLGGGQIEQLRRHGPRVVRAAPDRRGTYPAELAATRSCASSESVWAPAADEALAASAVKVS